MLFRNTTLNLHIGYESNPDVFWDRQLNLISVLVLLNNGLL